jgi:hypothetical protein
LNYVTSNEKYKAIFFVSLIVVIYGSLALGLPAGNLFDSILVPFQFPIFNILLFSLLFLNNLNLCSIFRKDFNFYIIRLKSKKNYFKTMIELSIVNYLFHFLLIFLIMATLILLTTINNISIYDYQNYSISNLVYAIYYMFRYVIYGLVITTIFTLIYIATNDKISIIIEVLFLSMFLKSNMISLYAKDGISLFIWTYFSATTFNTFSLDVLSSIIVLLILEIFCFILFKIINNKKVEIS